MKHSTRYALYGNLKFQVSKNVYQPAEDTFLAADGLTVQSDDTVLDMGTGCGILAIIAAQEANGVVAVDVNPHAIKCTKKNLKINGAADKVDVRRGDLFESIRKGETFSLIVFNAPYLPSDPTESKSWLDRSWAGGPTGREVIDRFIVEAPKHLKAKGRILLVQSSLAGVNETIERFTCLGLNARVVTEKKAAFESIALIQASHLSGQHTK